MVMLMMMETADDRDLWIPIYIYIYRSCEWGLSCTTVSHVHKPSLKLPYPKLIFLGSGHCLELVIDSWSMQSECMYALGLSWQLCGSMHVCI